MKNFKIPVLLVCIVAALLTLAACIGIYTVTFDPNGGSIVSGEAIQSVRRGEAAISPTPERQGYIFEGWEGDYSAITDDTTVRAKWTPIYTVTFDVNGGVAADPSLLVQYVTEGNDAVLPQVSRQGYQFDGWSIENLTNIHSDFAVTARWTRVWEVRYLLTGGNTANDSLLQQTVREGESPIDPQPTRSKFTFVRWLETVREDLNTKYYSAVWEKAKYTAAEISRFAKTSTVEITTYRPGGQQVAMGSGFYISASGLLVTNYHVIEGAYSIKVSNGTSECYVNRIESYNKEKDIAILSVNITSAKVPYLELNTALPTVGDTVYTMGSSLGLTNTFSSGIVSYTDREIDGMKFIQTTAPISSGNSGGPLINEYGEAIGMNTATYTEGQNLNLCITANDIKTVQKTKNSVSLSNWFYATTDFKYLPGDFVSAYSRPYNICQNGHTYVGELYRATDMLLTPASSKDQVLLVMIKVLNIEDMDLLKLRVVASKFKNNVLHYPEPISTTAIAVTMIDEVENCGWIICSIDIPDDKYAEGYKYYGLSMSGTSRPVQYEYFSWCMTPAEMEKFAEYFE